MNVQRLHSLAYVFSIAAMRLLYKEDNFEMPKKKTKKSVAKRFKKTATGKIKYSKAGSGHLLSKKTRKRKRNLRKRGVLSKVETKRINDMLT